MVYIRHGRKTNSDEGERKQKRMNPSQRASNAERYRMIAARVTNGYGEDPEAYYANFCRRKAKAGRAVGYAVGLAVVLNFLIQTHLTVLFWLTIANGVDNLIIMYFFSWSFGLLAVSMAVVWVISLVSESEKRDLLIEEDVLKDLKQRRKEQS